jgi:hypothetical protein
LNSATWSDAETEFLGNVFWSAVAYTGLIVLHCLLKLGFAIFGKDLPSDLDFPKLELAGLLVGFDGLTLSAATVIMKTNSLGMKIGAGIILAGCVGFVVFVLVFLLKYVRGQRRCKWKPTTAAPPNSPDSTSPVMEINTLGLSQRRSPMPSPVKDAELDWFEGPSHQKPGTPHSTMAAGALSDSSWPPKTKSKVLTVQVGQRWEKKEMQRSAEEVPLTPSAHRVSPFVVEEEEPELEPSPLFSPQYERSTRSTNQLGRGAGYGKEDARRDELCALTPRNDPRNLSPDPHENQAECGHSVVDGTRLRRSSSVGFDTREQGEQGQKQSKCDVFKQEIYGCLRCCLLPVYVKLSTLYDTYLVIGEWEDHDDHDGFSSVYDPLFGNHTHSCGGFLYVPFELIRKLLDAILIGFLDASDMAWYQLSLLCSLRAIHVLSIIGIHPFADRIENVVQLLVLIQETAFLVIVLAYADGLTEHLGAMLNWMNLASMALLVADALLRQVGGLFGCLVKCAPPVKTLARHQQNLGMSRAAGVASTALEDQAATAADEAAESEEQAHPDSTAPVRPWPGSPTKSSTEDHLVAWGTPKGPRGPKIGRPAPIIPTSIRMHELKDPNRQL